MSGGAERRGGLQMRKHSLGNGAVLAFAFVCLFSHACLAQERISDTESLVFDAVNRERAAKELPLLKWDEGLARAAPKHAELMAEQNLLLHRLPGEADLTTRAREAGASFSHITENIGMAAYARGLHDGRIPSPRHRPHIPESALESLWAPGVRGGSQFFPAQE